MAQPKPWINIPEGSDFSIHNLPYGIFSTARLHPRPGVAIGDHIVDLYGLASLGLFNDLKINTQVFAQNYLNDFISLGKKRTTEVRKRVQDWLCTEQSPLKMYPDLLVEQSEAWLHLPVQIGDCTDFYSSIDHATNVGKMFRDPENALLPNWKHIPVGYHSRSSSIVVSGVPVRRPKGQVMPKGADRPVFQASSRLDFELEMAFIIGKDSEFGKPVSTEEASDYIFGMVIFNDWSARDIQKWEYIPLGPFLGKNFASSISPWVVSMEALKPFKTKGPVQDPEVLPYLQYKGDHHYDIQLEVSLQPKDGQEQIVSRSNYKFMYWNMIQQLAHHTVNGCNVRVGDMMASGTISGPEKTAYGSMLELSWSGTKEIQLSDGSSRTFLEDEDTVSMKGFAEKNGKRVGFGEVRARILPSI